MMCRFCWLGGVGLGELKGLSDRDIITCLIKARKCLTTYEP